MITSALPSTAPMMIDPKMRLFKHSTVSSTSRSAGSTIVDAVGTVRLTALVPGPTGWWSPAAPEVASPVPFQPPAAPSISGPPDVGAMAREVRVADPADARADATVASALGRVIGWVAAPRSAFTSGCAVGGTLRLVNIFTRCALSHHPLTYTTAHTHTQTATHTHTLVHFAFPARSFPLCPGSTGTHVLIALAYLICTHRHTHTLALASRKQWPAGWVWRRCHWTHGTHSSYIPRQRISRPAQRNNSPRRTIILSPGTVWRQQSALPQFGTLGAANFTRLFRVKGSSMRGGSRCVYCSHLIKRRVAYAGPLAPSVKQRPWKCFTYFCRFVCCSVHLCASAAECVQFIKTCERMENKMGYSG